MKDCTKICLFTATGAENLWDELITLCEIRSFREEFPGVHIVLFSHSPDRTRRFLLSQKCPLDALLIEQYFPDNFRKNPIKNIWLFFHTLRLLLGVDRVYIWGGGLLYSAHEEGHSPLRIWWLRTYLTRLLGKPIFYHAIGISASLQELQPFAWGLFQDAHITVRDKESQILLKQLGYSATMLPDPVFDYKNAPQQSLKKTWMKIVGLALRSGFLSDASMESLVRWLLKKGYDVLFLPHSLHPTDERSHDGYYLQKFLYAGVRTTQSIEQTLEAYSMCDVILTMRLHSIILSLVLKKPFVAISYAQKTRSVLDAHQVNYFSPDTVEVSEIISALEKHITHG